MFIRWPHTDGRSSAGLTSREWERLHASWKALEVARGALSRDEARERLLPRFDIPADVLEQWICPFYFKAQTALTYGWIDYDRASFALESWTTQRIAHLRVIESYRPYVDRLAASDWDLDTTPLNPRSGDAATWRSRGTWRVPPVVVNPVGLGRPPLNADITTALQLVEGHTRVGSLRRFLRLGPKSGVTVAPQHAVYALRVR